MSTTSVVAEPSPAFVKRLETIVAVLCARYPNDDVFLLLRSVSDEPEVSIRVNHRLYSPSEEDDDAQILNSICYERDEDGREETKRERAGVVDSVADCLLDKIDFNQRVLIDEKHQPFFDVVIGDQRHSVYYAEVNCERDLQAVCDRIARGSGYYEGEEPDE